AASAQMRPKPFEVPVMNQTLLAILAAPTKSCVACSTIAMSGGGAGWLFRGGRIVPEERHQTGSANQGDFWKLEEHKPGVQSFTHFADGTAHKNRMQGNDFVKSVMYTRGVTCFSCHDVHGTDNPAVLWKPANRICLDC